MASPPLVNVRTRYHDTDDDSIVVDGVQMPSGWMDAISALGGPNLNRDEKIVRLLR